MGPNTMSAPGAADTLADLQGPAGNHYDKYRAKNPAIRRLTERFLRELDEVVTAVSPTSLLDVGCGDGHVTERIARLLPGVDVLGVDVADETLVASWEARRDGRARFLTGSAYSLPFESASFDAVTAFEVMEHLEFPAAALAELARVARRHVIVSVPREPVWRALNLAAGRYVVAGGNTPGHINHWSRAAAVEFAAGAGKVVDVRSPFPWTMVTVAR